MIKWLSGFLSAGNGDASSKRLLTIISYVASLAIAGFCVIHGVPLDGNVLVLLLGLSGVATTQQVIGNKNEIKKEIVDVEQSKD